MSDLVCAACGATASYADAAIADSLRTCAGDEDADTDVVRHTAVGPVHDGGKHDWEEA